MDWQLKVKTTPCGGGNRFGENDLSQLKEALEQGALFYFKGEKVKEFVKKFSDLYGHEHCVATSSGTAALHVAVSALNISVGDEVIVPPVSDLGYYIGKVGCYSTNDFKHLSTGDGGFITTTDADLAARAFEITDKNYYRVGTKIGRAASFLAPNYRMTELQGAVGIAQLDRLEKVTKRRNYLGDKLNELLKNVPGIHTQKIVDGGSGTYFYSVQRIDTDKLTVGIDEFCEAVGAEGVGAWRSPDSVIYSYPLFKEQNAYLNSHFPFTGTGKEYVYEKGLCPNAEELVETAYTVSISEFFTDEDIEETAEAIKKVATAYLKR